MEVSKRPKKRKKGNGYHSFASHPLNVLPLGNLYTGSTNCRIDSLGLFSFLQDDTIARLVCSSTLIQISAASKVFFAFTRLDTIWKNLYLEQFPSQIEYYRSWRKSLIFKERGKRLEGEDIIFQIKDTIYNEWYLPTIDILQWCAIDNIQRVNNLSLEDFKKNFEEPGIPVIINDVVPRWPAFTKWTREYLEKEYGETYFQADTKISYKLHDYMNYCDQCQDERPLYLFASDFVKKAPQIETEYDVPIYFQQDYFSYLKKRRPNNRWLLIGPTRAGATFHKDPNWTSAWNALISGKKKWIFYPPDVPPLGVIESAGGLEVTVPETLIQWFNDFYAKKHVNRIECIQYPGDLVYVPSGWWHQVINLEPSVAITHNFVNDNNLKKVYTFLKTKESLALFDDFSTVLKENCPEKYEDLLNSCNEKNWDEQCGDDFDFVLG